MDGRLTSRLLAKTLPDGLIEHWAEEHEVVERERKVDIVVFVWTLILGFPAGAKRTLASLRRRFEQAAGISIARAAFHDRFTPELATMLRRLVDWCLETKLDRLRGDVAEEMEGFRSLLAIDSTVLNLHEMLAPTWEATNEGEAACKMHLITNVVTNGASSVKVTDQCTPDVGPLKRLGSWVEDCLLMGDLGYYDFHLFHRIDQQDGYFLSRVRDDANPLIVESHQTTPGNSIDLAGKRLDEVLDRLRRQEIDVTVELDVQLQKYRGTSSWRRRRFRMVGLRDDDAGEYRLFFTNVSRDQLSPEEIDETYRLRWQVELLFTRLKTTLRLHELPSRKDHIVRALIWSSILALIVSGVLLRAMRRIRPDRVFPAQRADAVFRDFAELILREIALRRRDKPLDLFEMMLNEAADPNRSRKRSHDVLDAIPLEDPREAEAFVDAAA